MNSMSALATATPDVDANEFVTCRSVAETLHKHYPGHQWAVNMSGGVLYVRNMELSGQWGFVIDYVSIYSAADLERQAMRAGGELLDRYKVHIGAMRDDEITELPTDFRGAHLHSV